MSNLHILHKAPATVLAAFLSTATSLAQAAKPAVPPPVEEGSGIMTWISYLLLAAGLIGVSYYLWQRSQQSQPAASEDEEDESGHNWSGHQVDAKQEMEWFHKSKKPKKRTKVVGPNAERRTGGDRRARSRENAPAAAPASRDEAVSSARAYQEKLRKYQYSQLPVHSFIQITEARAFDRLPMAHDPDLLSAVDQAHDEYEEEEAFREIAVKVLAKFKTRNSVEGLSQMALYDLSSNIRSKAVSTLTDFDHESVFETILLACADPTREVRAAAARGLFRLSFDRAEAWKRIIDTGDKFRMSMAAKAAIESNILSSSIDRLIHQDMKIAYEAFALVALAIKAGEIQPIIDAFRSSRDDRVRFAIIHVVAVVGEPDSIEALSALESEDLSPDVKERLKDLAEIENAVPA
jgi:hypothetical protein